MKLFIGVFRYEYHMSIRRWSLWLAFGLLMILFLTSLLTPPETFEDIPNAQEVLSFAGTYAFMLNLFMPLVGGILVADRLVRDQKLGVDELIQSTALSRTAYLAAKYLGSLASVITPVVITCLLMGIITAAYGAPLSIIPAMLLAFLGVNFPAFAFVTAFSLACPLVMPVRVYQVLFTGYWFWGNFLSPKVMPTTNGTYLVANGEYVLTSFFGGFYGMGGPENQPLPNPVDAVINLSVLALCAGLALFAAHRYLAWKAAHA